MLLGYTHGVKFGFDFRFSGRSHTVYTGVILVTPSSAPDTGKRKDTLYDYSLVKLRVLWYDYALCTVSSRSIYQIILLLYYLLYVSFSRFWRLHEWPENSQVPRGNWCCHGNINARHYQVLHTDQGTHVRRFLISSQKTMVRRNV